MELEAQRQEQGLRRRTVGKFIKEKRIRAELTQWDIAANLRYSTAQFVSNWERGVSLPPLEALPKLAAQLGVPSKDMVEVMHSYHEQMLKLTKAHLTDIFRKAGRRA